MGMHEGLDIQCRIVPWMTGREDHTKNIPSYPIVEYIPVHENTIVNTTAT